MKKSLFEKIHWAIIVFLARRLPDCKTITPTLGETLDRKVSLRQKIIIRLHLFTCEACVRYLKQVRFLSEAMHKHEEKLHEDAAPETANMSTDTKDRLKEILRSRAT